MIPTPIRFGGPALLLLAAFVPAATYQNLTFTIFSSTGVPGAIFATVAALSLGLAFYDRYDLAPYLCSAAAYHTWRLIAFSIRQPAITQWGMALLLAGLVLAAIATHRSWPAIRRHRWLYFGTLAPAALLAGIAHTPLGDIQIYLSFTLRSLTREFLGL